MAEWLSTSSRSDNIALMDSQITLASRNPMRDKVIHAHADIHIDSIDTARHDGSQSASQGLRRIESGSLSPEDEVARHHAAQMQTMWDAAIKKHMDVSDGYDEVAVLLIKWTDQLDDLKTRDEVTELETLFRERFNYTTEVVELDVVTKPQHQLRSYISAFLRYHDGPSKLAIIYYTGHGRWRGDVSPPHLELTASHDPSVRPGFHTACCNWNREEEILKSDEVDCDVLTILDTCYSSNIVGTKSQSEHTRMFELLSASVLDETTASPGENSFTRALINTLKKLLVKNGPYSTFTINQDILLTKTRRTMPSQLWNILPNFQRHIVLAPLKPKKERQQELLRRPAPPKGLLTLRFALRDRELSEQQIEYIAKKLPQALNNNSFIGLSRIEWLGMQAAPPPTHFRTPALAMFVISKWRKFLVRRRKEKKHLDEIKLPMPMETSDGGIDVMSSPSPARKRTFEFSSDDLPDAKREQLLVVPQSNRDPPSPPISDHHEPDPAPEP